MTCPEFAPINANGKVSMLARENILVGCLVIVLTVLRADSLDQFSPASPAIDPLPLSGTDQLGDGLPPSAVHRIGTVRFRHGATVSSLSFAPDGNLLASGSWDGTVRLWELPTGREIRRFSGHKHGVNSIAFSPDGNILISGGSDGTIRIWNASTGKQTAILAGHNQGVQSVAFSNDGKTIASGGGDNSVRLWNVKTRKQVKELAAPRESSWVNCVAFSSIATILAAAGNDGIHLWDWASGKELRQLTRERIYCLAFSPDGKEIAAGGHRNGSVRVWDVEKGQEKRAFSGGELPVTALSYSPNGKVLASAGWDKLIRLWDTASGKEMSRLVGHKGWVHSIAFSRDGRHLASGGADHTIRLWDISTTKEVLQLPGLDEPIGSLAFTPNDDLMASGRLWNWRTGQELTNPCTGFPTTFSPNGKILASVDDEKLELFDVIKKTPVASANKELIYAIEFAPDGKSLASAGFDGKIIFWEVPKLKRLTEITGLVPRSPLRYSPNGETIAWQPELHAISLLSLKENKEIRRLVFPQDRRPSVGSSDDYLSYAWSSDANFLACGCRNFAEWADKPIVIWQVTTGKPVIQFGEPQGHVHCLALSPDDKSLATGSEDGAICLWETTTGNLRGKFRGHQGTVGALAFSDTGDYLASASDDTTILIWKVNYVLEDKGGLKNPNVKKEPRALWNDLASKNASQAFEAVCLLQADRAQTPTFLGKRLLPIFERSKEDIRRLLVDLDNDDFGVREEATKKLMNWGKLAEPELQRALKSRISAEMRRRIETILHSRDLQQWSGESLRFLRAMEVLEKIGTPEAGKVLKHLSEGDQQAPLIREAKNSITRLSKLGNRRP